MPDQPPLAQLEPIRLPAWAVSLLIVFVFPLATAVLTGVAWKPVLATAIATCALHLVVAERARANVVPIVTHEADIATTRAIGYAAAVEAKETGREEGKEHALGAIEQLADAKRAARRVAAAARKKKAAA